MSELREMQEEQHQQELKQQVAKALRLRSFI